MLFFFWDVHYSLFLGREMAAARDEFAVCDSSVRADLSRKRRTRTRKLQPAAMCRCLQAAR